MSVLQERHRRIGFASGLIVALALALSVFPASSMGFHFLSTHTPWPGKITYFNKAKAQDPEVRKAASIWNSSGIRIKFVRVSSARRADLIIVGSKQNSCGNGYGGSHYTSRNGGPLRPDGAGITLYTRGPREACRPVNVLVMVHEMGHVLGLGHEDRRCAVMNSVNGGPTSPVPDRCKVPRGNWFCSALTADDLRGAKKLYGGRPHVRKPAYCPLPGTTVNPAAIRNFSGTSFASDDAGAKLTWSLPPKKQPTSLLIYRGKRNGPCPGRGGSGSADKIAIRAKALKAFDSPLASGTYCYMAVSLNEYGDPGRTAQTKVTVNGFPPTAFFDYYNFDGTTASFNDRSRDDDGEVVAWDWDFGDGSPHSSLQNPEHTYAAAGTYQVTLRVTDDEGNAATDTEPVSVGLDF